MQAHLAANDAIVESEARAGRPFHDFQYGALLDVCAVCGRTREDGNHWNYDEPPEEDFA